MATKGSAVRGGRRRRFARRVSLLFNPLVIGVPLVVLIGVKDQGGFRTDLVPVALLCVGIMSLLPLAYTLVLMRLGIVKNFNVSDRRQRVYLFPVLLACFLAVVQILHRTEGVSPLVVALLFFGLLNCLVCALISLWFKISLHCAGLGALTVGLYIAFGLPVFLLGLAVLALTAWARLEVREHRVAEVVAGSVFGVVATGLEFALFYGNT